MQHKEVGKGLLVSGKAVMVRLNCGSHDSVFVYVEPAINRIGNLILEKGGCFSGINI